METNYENWPNPPFRFFWDTRYIMIQTCANIFLRLALQCTHPPLSTFLDSTKISHLHYNHIYDVYDVDIYIKISNISDFNVDINIINLKKMFYSCSHHAHDTRDFWQNRLQTRRLSTMCYPNISVKPTPVIGWYKQSCINVSVFFVQNYLYINDTLY